MTSIPTFAQKISDLPGARFASFVYRSKQTGELARVTIILGASTTKLYQRDIAILDQMIPTLSGLALEAATAIRASRQESLTVGIGNNSTYTNAGTYVFPQGFDNGIKIGVTEETMGRVYVTGLLQSKVTLEEGTYKEVKSKPLTLAKKEIEKSLPSSWFRQYILTNVITARLSGDTLEIQTADEPMAVVDA